MKLVKQFFIILAVSVLLAAGLSVYAFHEFFTPIAAAQSKPARLTIPLGTSLVNISQSLQAKGLIRHAWSFEALALLTRTNRRIQAGMYDLSPAESSAEILQKLTRGETVKIRVTIPEGYTLKQIAAALDAKEVVSKNGFIETTQSATITFPGIPEKIIGLEGFLFPDTYEFSPHITPNEAYAPMVSRFQELVVPVYLKSKKHLTLQKAIVLASLVEHEGKLRRELPLIAAVYTNRLKKGIPLECDATIQYLLPKPKELLDLKDLQVESPYNTYLHPGLPPGPIGNPGLPAVKAVLFPANVPYLYYVAKGNGAHSFSMTYQDHLSAVGKYKQWLLRRHSPPKNKRPHG